MADITQKKMVKHISYLFFKAMIVVLLTTSFFVKAESIQLGYFTLAPHIFKGKYGNAVGPLPEFLNKHIGPAMGVTFKLVNIPLARGLKSMDSGKLAGMALLGYSQHRALLYSYPKQSFYSMKPALATQKSIPLNNLLLPSTLKKISIGYVTGAIISPYMRKHEIEFLNISGYNPWERNIQMLIGRRVDAIYSPDAISILHIANSVNVIDQINITLLPEEPIKVYSLFLKNEVFNELNLAARYDKAFKQVNGAQVYKKLLEQHFNPSNEQKNYHDKDN